MSVNVDGLSENIDPLSKSLDPRRVPWESQTKDGQVLLSMPWEVFVLGVAVLSIANIVLLILIRNPDLEQVLAIMDVIITGIFLADFLWRIHVATDHRAYFFQGLGWLDLISIVPFLRIARVLRILRVARIVRRMGGLRSALRVFFADRASGSLMLVVLIALLVLQFGSMLVLAAERGAPGANIETAGDALWYTLVTISTVGYGDQYPVTELGRIFGSLIIIVGVGVFGTITGFLANAFLAPRRASGEGGAEAMASAPPEASPTTPREAS